MHAQVIEDHDGNAVAVHHFCSSACHRDWCHLHGVEYGGWNGAISHEGPDDEYCAKCGVRIAIGAESRCTARCLPILVNLIGPIQDQCAHGVHQCLLRQAVAA